MFQVSQNKIIKLEDISALMSDGRKFLLYLVGNPNPVQLSPEEGARVKSKLTITNT